jgi:hypothetical protein
VRLSLVHCPKEAAFRFGLETRKTGSPTCWISVRYFAVLSAMIETLSVVLKGAGYRPTCEVILVVDVGSVSPIYSRASAARLGRLRILPGGRPATGVVSFGTEHLP